MLHHTSSVTEFAKKSLSMKTPGEIVLQISSFHLPYYHGSHVCLLTYLASSQTVLLRPIDYDSVAISGKGLL